MTNKAALSYCVLRWKGVVVRWESGAILCLTGSLFYGQIRMI